MHYSSRMRKLLRENGLSLATCALFMMCICGQALTGRLAYNEEAAEHGRRALSLASYLVTGDFVEAVFENWESEFLQMAVFVLLTRVLRQKGSSESKQLSGPEDVDADPREKRNDPAAPWPVRRGGWVLVLYEHSLSLALFLLFVTSFALHAYGGMRADAEETLRHGGASRGLVAFLGSAKFWQQSFQNWQSEFMAVGVLVVLSIVLRERSSPQSKAVADPTWKTGGS
jgi:hypothetical protein